MRSVCDQARGVEAPVWRLFLGCCLLFMCVAPCVVAQTDGDAATAERRIKAAFLYKFAGYVEWPDGAFPRPDTPVTIVIDGDDQLADEVAQVVAGRTVAGRTLVVRKLKKDASSLDAHILFARDVHEDRPPISDMQSQPTLIVTDSRGALTRGSTINFLVVDEHVRFEVSLEDAERRGLRLSSRLLAVAQNLRTGKP
jgi:hypothetical protein